MRSCTRLMLAVLVLSTAACGKPESSLDTGVSLGAPPCVGTTGNPSPGTVSPQGSTVSSSVRRSVGLGSAPPATSGPPSVPMCTPSATGLSGKGGTSVPAAPRTAFDFDHDGKADFVITTAAGAWTDLSKSGAGSPLYAGMSGDRPVPADYDGTGDSVAVIDTADNWVTQSRSGSITFPPPPQLPGYPISRQFLMVPLPADYEGTGKAQAAWYRDSDGTWFIQGHAPIRFGNGPTTAPPGPGLKANDGNDQDIPVPADYDGDGKADLATFNPRTRVWRVKSSRDGSVSSVTIPGSNGVVSFPVPGDYDGVGHAQRAVFGSDGWYIEGHAAPILFGNDSAGSPQGPGYLIPTPGDYDGDGKMDLSYVSTSGIWTTRSSADPSRITTFDIGPFVDDSSPLPVEFTTGMNYLLARVTLVARNCTPGFGRYPHDC